MVLKEALNKTPKQSKPLSCLLVNGKECNDPRAMAEEDLLQELGRQVLNTGGPGLFFHLRATSEREKW